MRSGRFIKQPTNYTAFIPAPLPPDPPIKMDANLTRLLSDADRCLGRLDGITTVLPNPDLLVSMYVRQEAVLSSQIEGTQATLEDILAFEAGGAESGLPSDVGEVVNYIEAMNYGLKRLAELPLSLRLIREIHGKLLDKTRGANKDPGEFRKTQNWIGPGGSTLANAAYVPPPPQELQYILGDFEKFLHDETLPVLIQCGIMHAQFETIHPFLDGNGRVGRLLITFLLCQKQILHKPLLYLSYYLKAHRAEYYDRLMAVRTDGNWEDWLRFFLRGVVEVSRSATDTARAILRLREQHRVAITEKMGSSASQSWKLLDRLYERPFTTIAIIAMDLECSFATASKIAIRWEEMGLLKEVTGQKRNKIFTYEPYLALFRHPVIAMDSDTAPLQTNTF